MRPLKSSRQSLKSSTAPSTIQGAAFTEDKKTMTTIREKDFSVALINTFYVKPDQAETLVQLLIKATDEVMRHYHQPYKSRGSLAANPKLLAKHRRGCMPDKALTTSAERTLDQPIILR